MKKLNCCSGAVRATRIGGILIALIFCAVLGAKSHEANASAGLEAGMETASGTTPLCRLGVNDSSGNIGQFDLSALRLGWYIDYRARNFPQRPDGIEFGQMIRLGQVGTDGYTVRSPDVSAIPDMIANNPGSDWFVSNEPDRPNPIFKQDALEPHVYATAYHDLYNLIKSQDPDAQIFAGSIVQATEVRLKYLDEILASYLDQFGRPMPVDGWSIHGFILNEVSCESVGGDLNLCWGAEIPPGLDDETGQVIDLQQTDEVAIFQSNIQRFRQWMTDRGYRDTPLYLSEYGVLIPSHLFPEFDDARVNQFMTKTFDYILQAADAQVGYRSDGNRLVQRLSWYSTEDKVDFNGYLFDVDKGNALSPMGQNYANYAAALSEEVDLHLTRVQIDPPSPPVAGGNADLTLMAYVANAGNRLAQTSTIVRFFDGNPQSGGQQIGSDQAVNLSGCGDRLIAQVEWSDVPPGEYEVYAVVDPDDQIEESGNLPNTASRKVIFASDEVYLPIVGR